MTIRVGINGFGRMGRLALRAAWGDPAITFVRFTVTDWPGCDVVIESSGRFRKTDVLQPCLDQGVNAWHDNEWGYANRTAQLVRLVGTADR